MIPPEKDIRWVLIKITVFQIYTYEVYFHNFELNKIMKSNRFLFIFVDKIMKTWILRNFPNSTHYCMDLEG